VSEGVGRSGQNRVFVATLADLAVVEQVTLLDTMVPDIDIWRAAMLLIRQHGQNAEIVAAHRADELWEREDHEGREVWLRIKRAIVELQKTPTGPGH
jgi:hypothetical protein